MFCHNCGKQIPDNSKFCTGCGTKIANAAPAQQAGNTSAPRNDAKKPKKKSSKLSDFLTTMVVVLLVFVLARSCGESAGRKMADNKNKAPESTANISGTIAINPELLETEPDNPAYHEVFTERSIIFVPTLFFGMDSDSYVHVDADGMVDHQEFGHKDDVVVEFAETVYVPVNGWSDADKETYVQAIQDTYGNSGLSCASLENVNMGLNYISFTLRLRNLDKSENLRAVVDAGFVMMEGQYDLWGMSGTEDALLESGYIKK